MKRTKRTLNWLTILFAIIAIVFVAFPIAKAAGGTSEIVKGVVDALNPATLFDFTNIAAFFESFDTTLLPVVAPQLLALAALLYSGLGLVVWLFMLFIMKRPGQIFVWLIVGAFALVAIDIAGTNLGAIIAATMEGSESVDFLSILAVFNAVVAVLLFVPGIVFNVVWLCIARKDYKKRKLEEKQALLEKHGVYIDELKERVVDAELALNELKESIAKDDGHADYLRRDIMKAKKGVRDAKRALRDAERKYFSKKEINEKELAKKAAKKGVKAAPVKEAEKPVEKAPEVKPVVVEEKAPEVTPVIVEKAPAEKKEKIPFEKRIAKAEKSVKVAYNEIKNEILSYGVKSRISSSGDTFRLHTKTYVKMVMAGKGLKLYLALDPKAYADSPIPVGDASKKNLYKEIPLVFKVKSDLSVRRAKQLVADAMAKDGIAQGTVEKVTWVK